MNKGESNKRFLSALFMCAVAALLIFSGPGHATIKSMGAPDPADPADPPFPILVTGNINYTSGHPDSNVVISLLNNESGSQAIINTTAGKCIYSPGNPFDDCTSYGACRVNNSCDYDPSTGLFKIELYGTNASDGDSVVITATDKFGKTNNTTTTLANNISAGNVTTEIGTLMLEMSEIPWNITLAKGWNLISFPVNMTGELVSTVMARTTNCTMISRYSGGRFNSYFYTTEFGWIGSNFDITDASGYFVYCTANSSISVKGMPLSGVNKTLTNGWNLIGWISTSSNSTASNVSRTISNCTMISRYSGGRFNSYFYTTEFGWIGDDFQVSAGKGYFVYTTTNTSWYQE